jgi:hypothetical protein
MEQMQQLQAARRDACYLDADLNFPIYKTRGSGCYTIRR